MSQLTAVGYLIGAGSMTLGVEQAGFKVEALYETPGYARNAKTWSLNRQDLPPRVLELDANDTTLQHLHGEGHQSRDLIYGNPPCGGVSNMGHIGLGPYNPTNACMRHWIRMVVPARPRAILMESGYALNGPRFQPLLADLEGVLEKAGYYYWTWEFWSAQLGTPQTRRRMFLAASLEAPNERLVALNDLPNWRAGDEPAPPGAACLPHIAMLEDVEPSPEPFTLSGRECDEWENCTIHHHFWDQEGEKWNRAVAGNRDRLRAGYSTPSQIAMFERGLAERKDDPKAWSQLMAAKKKLWEDCPTELDQTQCFRRIQLTDPNQPIATLVGAYKFVHPTRDRLLTMTELGLLMGYPIDWRFHRWSPSLIAQGIPSRNAEWAADRLVHAAGLS